MKHRATTVDFDTAVQNAAIIVCDWNGTIVDDADRALNATNLMLAELGMVAIDLSTFRSTFRLPLSSFVQALGVGPDDEVPSIQLWNRLLSVGKTKLQPGVRQFLDRANEIGVLVGVVSAAETYMVSADASSLGVAESLSFIVGSVESKSTALARIAINAAGPVLYIGDTEYDLLEARTAGVLAIGFAGGYRPAFALHEIQPLAVIDDFGLLTKALQKTRDRVFPVSCSTDDWANRLSLEPLDK